MKKMKILVFGIISGLVGFLVYIELPLWYPTYDIGSCISDTKKKVVYRISDYENKMKTPNYLKARVLKTPGGYLDPIVGTSEYVKITSKDIIPVPCP